MREDSQERPDVIVDGGGGGLGRNRRRTGGPLRTADAEDDMEGLRSLS